MSSDIPIEVHERDFDPRDIGGCITSEIRYSPTAIEVVDYRYRTIDKKHGLGYYAAWGWYYDLRFDDVRRVIIGGNVTVYEDPDDRIKAFAGLYVGGANDYGYYLPDPENVPKTYASKCKAYLTTLSDRERDVGLRLYMEKAIEPDESRIEELRTGLGGDGKAHKPAKMPWEKEYKEPKNKSSSQHRKPASKSTAGRFAARASTARVSERRDSKGSRDSSRSPLSGDSRFRKRH